MKGQKEQEDSHHINEKINNEIFLRRPQIGRVLGEMSL